MKGFATTLNHSKLSNFNSGWKGGGGRRRGRGERKEHEAISATVYEKLLGNFH